MKKLSLLLVMLVCALIAYAVPAANVTITHTQKDGTVLTLRLVGDEHMHYYMNVATGEAMRKAADGDFVTISGSDLSVQAEQAAARRTNANEQRIARLPRMQQMNDRRNGPAYSIGNFSSMTGTKKGLVILVNFTDVTFRTGATSTKEGNTTIWDYTGTQSAFANQFNQQGYSLNGHIGSVKDYFSAQSYDRFTVDFDVVGPVTVSNAMAYYGAPKGTNNDSYPASMVIEACKLADEAGVDFSAYDWTGDGYVDQVFVIYAGYNQAQGASENTIWPHEWDLNSARYYGDGTGSFLLDGKRINTYACTSELAGYSGTTMDGIGTACHEFSHCLGYPDLYDTDYTANGSGFGMSYYDLMAAGSYNGPNGHGEVPCGYSAYERWMAGWITPTELNADAATISGMVTIDSKTNGGTVLSGNPTLANSPSRAYIIKNGSDNDYYLLENRPSTGYFRYFSRNTSGSGLFITHVNYSATAWQQNTVNAYASNQRFIFIPADGTRSTSSGYTTDFFPTSSVTSFTEVEAKQVTNIARTGELISFDYNGGFNDTGESGDGGDEPGEGEGDDIAVTPVPDDFAGYYNTTIEHLNGRTLELAVKAIVMNPEKFNHISYSSLWKAYEMTDVVPSALLKDPARTDQVYDMYADYNTFTKYYSDKDHSQTGGINREHCVPNSWWGGKTGNATAYTDLHHLVPGDGAANNAKSNHPLGEYTSEMTLSWPTETKTNTSGNTYVVADNTDDHSGSWSHVWKTSSNTYVFEPADEFKGDFARMYLYVVCAYEGDLTWQTTDNTMFSNNTADHNYTVIADDAKALLLKWHRQDPVSQKEQVRNNAVQSVQGNRNPFIDYPVLVEYIWGDSIAKTTFNLDMTKVNYDKPDTNPGDPDNPVTEDISAIYFPHIAHLGQPFTEPAFSTNSGGTQTWSSSNPSVATVDNQGHVTTHAAGTTVITVTQAETATYSQGSASYMIKVVE